MAQDHILISTAKTNLSQHDLWRFAVIITWEGDQGTMGFVMNQSVANIRHSDISRMYGVGSLPSTRIWCGGPLMTDRCTVLHSAEYRCQDTRQITDHAAITFNREIMRDINQGQGPRHYKIMLGHCQWESGQLDAELTRGVWHHMPWHHTAWASYKRKDKMWRRIIEQHSVTEANSFLDQVFAP